MAYLRPISIACQAVLLGGVVLMARHTALADDEPDQPASAPVLESDTRLRHIIERVETNEPLYRQLETVVRFTRRYADASQNGRLVPAVMARWHTILQGDLVWFRAEDLAKRTNGDKRPGGTLSVFDGQISRNIEYGNCVNIRQGRYEPWQITPPHAWAMHHFRANFPLSVFLRGTDAIDNHPKPRHFAHHGGSLYDFARLEVISELDETIDGLDCAKVRCRRWYSDKSQPVVEVLWLAKERNYLCVRSQTLLNDRGFIGDEGRVTEWRELKPGFWLPTRVLLKIYASPGRLGDAPVAVQWHEELIVDEATPDSNYPLSRFRDVELPDKLPVYRIDADGYLENSPRRTNTKPRPQAELDQLIARVRAEEDRYARYDVTVDATYRKIHLRNAFDGETVSQDISERSVAFDGRLYSQSTRVNLGADRATSRSDTLHVYDGVWNRERSHGWSEQVPGNKKGHAIGAGPGGGGPAERRHHDYASLGRGGPDAIDMFRPHTAIFANNDNRLRAHRLSSLLASPMYDEVSSYRLQTDYLGPEPRDGFDCEKLWFAHVSGGQPPNSGFYLWLAKDRNYLPIRYESYSRNDGLPTSVGYADDLREAAPGIWYPYHTVRRAHVSSDFVEGVCEGRILVNWAYEQRARGLGLPREAQEELFQVNLPADTSVSVFTGKHRSLGTIRQVKPGPADISDQKWQIMLLADRPSRDEEMGRKQALAALVGQPAPAMPKLEWVQGAPEPGETLQGRVVLLFYWAEWRYSESTLRAVAEHARELAQSGVAVIGVHARGSTLDEVRRALQELQVQCAIAVDAPGATEPSWGALYESFDLRDPTHAFVIDRDGNIAAEGTIDKMIQAASARSQQK